MRRLIAAVLVVCLLSTTAAAATMTAIDADHGLTSDTEQAAFEEEGYATTDLNAPNMTVSVAAELSQCGVEDWTVSDLRNDFLCVEYGEEIDRTIRLHIPQEYWHPYVREEVSPVAGDETASFQPVEDRGVHRGDVRRLRPDDARLADQRRVVVVQQPEGQHDREPRVRHRRRRRRRGRAGSRPPLTATARAT